MSICLGNIYSKVDSFYVYSITLDFSTLIPKISVPFFPIDFIGNLDRCLERIRNKKDQKPQIASK